MSIHGLQPAIASLTRERAELVAQLQDAERDHRRELDAFLREIVEIADGVERLRAVAGPEVGSQLGTVGQQIEELLLGHGVSAFRPAPGDMVDGLTCEVMATLVRPGLRAGTVSRVLRAGYRHGERIIRRAGVEVVKE